MLRIILIVAALSASAADTWPARAVPVQQQVGSIAGTVRVKRAPPPRTAERYAGAAPGASRPLQPLPVVAYLKGGTAARAGEARPRLLQKDTAFVPGALAVQVGTTVVFPNGDPFFHNVFSYSRPKRFDLGRYPQGEAKAVRFDSPGVVKVYCEVHASMRALIVVTETPYFAVADAAGRFAIRDVPAGRYELVIVDADAGQRTLSVTVSGGSVTEVSVDMP